MNCDNFLGVTKNSREMIFHQVESEAARVGFYSPDPGTIRLGRDMHMGMAG